MPVCHANVSGVGNPIWAKRMSEGEMASPIICANAGHSSARNSHSPSAISAAVAVERTTIDRSIASASQTPA